MRSPWSKYAAAQCGTACTAYCGSWGSRELLRRLIGACVCACACEKVPTQIELPRAPRLVIGWRTDLTGFVSSVLGWQ